MLKLSRREGESFILYTTDGVILITFEEMRGNQANVSIDAPDEVDILRSELVEED